MILLVISAGLAAAGQTRIQLQDLKTKFATNRRLNRLYWWRF